VSPSMPERGRAFLQRWRGRPLLLREQDLWDGSRAWPGFDSWCAAHAGMACTLWLSTPLLHELVCEPDLPLASDTAALAWAQALLQHYHGDAALAWPLAAWQQGRRRGVSVLHGASLDSLRATAARHQVRLLAARPWWAQVLRLALQRHRALRHQQARLLVLEGTRLAVLELQRGQLAGLSLRRLEAATPQALLQWCAEGAAAQDTPSWAIGYGLQAGPLPGLQVPQALDAVAPPPQWLGGGQP
jgi:hypothetical protein